MSVSSLVGCTRLNALRSVQRCSVLMHHLRGRSFNREFASSAVHAEEEVLFDSVGVTKRPSCRLITLNRPKALNALNLNMCRLITRDMKAVAEDESVRLVVMKGAGDKAFCAGGDIRAVTEAGKVGDPLAQDFFQAEYKLNHLIGTYKKPFVAVIDGITMGGGVGLSVHGPFRVATEHTLFAMPETFIGLFPDVGGSYFLPRLSGSLGMFLALTGYRLKGRDVHWAGVATHFVERNKLPELIQELATVSDEFTYTDVESHYSVVQRVLDSFHQQCLQVDARKFSLAPFIDDINRCFDKDTVEGILAALETNGSDWAKKQIEVLSKMSPTSMKITHHQLMEGANLSFPECFKMEYRMSQASMAGEDFYEGVRAVIVDKDNCPRWNPPTLTEVTPEVVQRYFARLPEEKELKL